MKQNAGGLKLLHSEQGGVFLAMVFVLFIMAVGVVFVLSQTNSQLKNALRLELRTKGYYSAVAGVEHARALLLDTVAGGFMGPGTPGGTLLGQPFTPGIIPITGDITSDGIVPPGFNNVRVMIKRPLPPSGTPTVTGFADGIPRQVYLVSSQTLDAGRQPLMTLQAIVLRWEKDGVGTGTWRTSILSQRERKI